MKSLIVSIGVVILVSVLIFTAFHALGVVDKVAGPLASSALGFITFIHDKVDKAFSEGRSRVTPGIVPVSAFDIRWPYMVVYGTLTFIGVLEASTIIALYPAMLVTSLIEKPSEAISMGVTGFIALPTVAWGTFLLGRWIGIRSAISAYWIVPLSMALGRALDGVLLYVILPDARPVIGQIFHDKTTLHGAETLLGLLVAIGLVGVWRGNRIRLGAYFNSLLKQVSPSTRETLLAMTFEEARSATHGVGTTS